MSILDEKVGELIQDYQTLLADHKELLKHINKLSMCCDLDEYENETSLLIVSHRKQHANVKGDL